MCKSCIPPICNVGKIAIASTIIPIPPNHCNRALHINIPSVNESKFDITVAPVVVIPLTDSKKASVYDKEDTEYINGIEPKSAIINQDEIVKTKACLMLNLIFFFLNEKYNIIPIIKVKRLI